MQKIFSVTDQIFSITFTIVEDDTYQIGYK